VHFSSRPRMAKFTPACFNNFTTARSRVVRGDHTIPRSRSSKAPRTLDSPWPSARPSPPPSSADPPPASPTDWELDCIRRRAVAAVPLNVPSPRDPAQIGDQRERIHPHRTHPHARAARRAGPKRLGPNDVVMQRRHRSGVSESAVFSGGGVCAALFRGAATLRTTSSTPSILNDFFRRQRFGRGMSRARFLATPALHAGVEAQEFVAG